MDKLSLVSHWMSEHPHQVLGLGGIIALSATTYMFCKNPLSHIPGPKGKL